jgi:hypothetical protein
MEKELPHENNINLTTSMTTLSSLTTQALFSHHLIHTVQVLPLTWSNHTMQSLKGIPIITALSSITDNDTNKLTNPRTKRLSRGEASKDMDHWIPVITLLTQTTTSIDSLIPEPSD